MFRKITPYAFVLCAATMASSGAQAQVSIGNGVTFGLESMANVASAPGNIIDLGTAATSGLVSNLPLMVTMGANTTATITFTGSSGLYNGTTSKYSAAPSLPTGPLTTNYLLARSGAVTMSFNTDQRYFSALWGSVDSANSLSFYNNDTLIKTVAGSMIMASGYGDQTASGTYNVEFSFSELAYNRVVADPANTSMELAPLSISTEALAVAPIPLNAASLGGLMSFLMMLAMRGKGGPQVAICMGFASIMPRRRVPA
jgi:hypothetical protein